MNTQLKKSKPSRKLKKFLHVVIAMALLMIALLGTLHNTFIGRLIANELRIVFGQSYFIICFFLFIYALFYLMLRKEPRFQWNHYSVGLLVIYIGILLLQTIQYNNQFLEQSDQVFHDMWQHMLLDLEDNQMTTSFGGGMLGLAIYVVFKKFLDFLPMNYFAWGMILLGFFIFIYKKKA